MPLACFSPRPLRSLSANPGSPPPAYCSESPAKTNRCWNTRSRQRCEICCCLCGAPADNLRPRPTANSSLRANRAVHAARSTWRTPTMRVRRGTSVLGSFAHPAALAFYSGPHEQAVPPRGRSARAAAARLRIQGKRNPPSQRRRRELLPLARSARRIDGMTRLDSPIPSLQALFLYIPLSYWGIREK